MYAIALKTIFLNKSVYSDFMYLDLFISTNIHALEFEDFSREYDGQIFMGLCLCMHTFKFAEF